MAVDGQVRHGRRPYARRTWLTAVGAVVAAGLVAGLPTTAGAAGPSWSAGLRTTGATTSLAALTTTGPGDVWAVGGQTVPDGLSAPAAWHRTGSGWVRQVLPGDWSTHWGYYTGVAASGPDDVWATGVVRRRTSGAGGPLLTHWDGSRWQRRAVPQSASSPVSELVAAAVRGPDDAWFAGTDTSGGGDLGRPVLLHWDGVSLAQVPVAVSDPSCTPSFVRVTSLAVDAGSLWLGLDCQLLTDGRQRGVVQRFAGGTWSLALSLPPSTGVLALADRDGTVWGTGTRQVAGPDIAPVVLRGTAASGLSTVPVSAPTGTILWGIATAPDAGVYAVGEGRPAQTPVVLHGRVGPYGATTWTSEPVVGHRALFAAAVDATGAAWAAGPAFGGWLGGQSSDAAVLRRSR